MAGFSKAGTDLDSLFEPLGTLTKRANVGFTIAGTDISNNYASAADGSAYGTTNFLANGTDIGTLFAAVGTTKSYWIEVTSNVRNYSIASDSNANLYVLTWISNDDGYMGLIKYSPSGTVLWKKRFWYYMGGGWITLSAGTLGAAVAYRGASGAFSTNNTLLFFNASDGSLAMAREISESMTSFYMSTTACYSAFIYWGGTYYNPNTQQLEDPYFIKYDSGGNVYHQKRYYSARSMGQNTITSVSVDPSGNFYMYGFSSGSPQQGFIIGCDSSGGILGSNQESISNSGNWTTRSVAAGTTRVYTCAQTGQSTYYNVIGAYDKSLNLQWSKYATAGSSVAFISVAVDSSDNLYVLGTANGTANLLLVKFNSSGTLQWQRTISGTNMYVYADHSIHIDKYGDICISFYTLPSGINGVHARLPPDGSKTGTYGGLTYAASSYTFSSSAIYANPINIDTAANSAITSTAVTPPLSTLSTSAPTKYNL